MKKRTVLDHTPTSTGADGDLERSSGLGSDLDPETVEGFVDRLTPWGASGWAWMPGTPDTLLEIEAVVNGIVIARATADQMRPDIAFSGRGNGHYGFMLRFPELFSQDDKVVLRALSPTGPITLAGAVPASIEGFVEAINQRGATGWAWNPTAPDSAVAVEAVWKGEVIGRTIADESRDDLIRTHRGTGKYGFHLLFNESLTDDDVSPIVRVLGAGVTQELLRPVTPSIEGRVESFSPSGIIGWAWLPTAPEKNVEVEASFQGRSIGRALANEMRRHLQLSGRGTGQYGFTIRFTEPLEKGCIPTVRAIGHTGDLALPVPSTWDTDDHAGKAPAAPEVLANITKQEPGPAAGLNIEGSVDHVTRWGAAGWAWTPSTPDRVIEVEAVVEGHVIGHAPANQTRPDLEAAGKGTGRYGFLIAFEEPLARPIPPIFRVQEPEGTWIAPAVHDVIGFDLEETIVGTAPAVGGDELGSIVVEGHVDILTRGGAEGWAWIPAQSEAAVEVEAVLNGSVIGRTKADQLRPDLAEWGKGTGRYGFKMSFEEVVLGTIAPRLRVLTPADELAGTYSLPPISRDDLTLRPRGSLNTFFGEHAAFTTLRS